VLLLPLCIYQQFDRSTWTEERYLPRLASPDPAVRTKAVEALGALENPTPHRIEVLAQLLGDPDARLRFQALLSLVRLGSASAPAAPRIAQLLKDPDEGLRARAAREIIHVGADPQFVANTLVAAMHDASFGVRVAAVHSLGEMVGKANGELFEFVANALVAAT